MATALTKYLVFVASYLLNDITAFKWKRCLISGKFSRQVLYFDTKKMSGNTMADNLHIELGHSYMNQNDAIQ